MDTNFFTEMDCGSNFAYLLDEGGSFVPTQYKVLLNQATGCLLPCVRMSYNGREMFYYITGSKKPLSSMLSSMSGETFLTVAANLLRAVVQVRQIGFLPCENIDLSLDKIFVNTVTEKVSLVYVPCSPTLFEDGVSMENELRSRLIKLVNGVPNLSTPKTTAFAVDLANGALSLESVLRRLDPKPVPPPPPAKKLYLLLGEGPAGKQIAVTKDHFVIGRTDKGTEKADFVLSESKYIGRRHCQIDTRGSSFVIKDLRSVNHTFLNGNQLAPEKEYPLKNGDTIKVVDFTLRVVIK